MAVLKSESPFSINFRKLQRYRVRNSKDAILRNAEYVIFFEYLMVMATNFGYKEFYHSTARIQQETFIKRSSLDTIIDHFQRIGILNVEVKGYPMVKHFFVNVDIVCALLPEIYQFAENSKLDVEINKLYAEFYKQFAEINQQENINTRNNSKETKEATKDKKGDDIAISFNFSLLETKKFLDRLENKFNFRRKEKDESKYPPVSLPFKKEVLEFAQTALNENGQQLLEDAWLVYIDKIIANELRPQQILKYFFSQKEGSFDVIGTMADYHNTHYVFTSRNK